MNNRKTPSDVHLLIEKMVKGSVTERRAAIRQLELRGKSAVPEIIVVTTSRDPEVRREAADLLGRIKDESSIPILIDMLEDPKFEVRWRASESLFNMGRASLVPLLEELTKRERFGSAWFLDSVHHILKRMNEKGYLGPSIEVLEALEGPYREETVPWAAERALELLLRRPQYLVHEYVHP